MSCAQTAGKKHWDALRLGSRACLVDATALDSHVLVKESSSVSPSKVCIRGVEDLLGMDATQAPGDLLSGEEATDDTRIGARNRWKRLRNTVVFAKNMSAFKASRGNDDLLQEELHSPVAPKPDEANSDKAGAGAQLSPPIEKAKGRRGMEGLIVQQDKCYLSYFQDFYVAYLKMPALHFFIGVFVAPVLLALIFVPVYLSDTKGLKAMEPQEEQGDSSKIWNCFNVLLYSLSLSTTFGGSPLSACSPFCLLVANLHTLMAQFLFVFLSGAVFARMSKPAHPIRCSTKAIIKNNDFSGIEQVDEDGKCKVLVVRLVLTGPPPCELVDAKIRLTFRIYVKLSSGSMFCSTQDLDLVRSEVAYLRYGLTVRHVINSKSPVYGHTLATLAEGDASFSLTIMGVERSSMQPIFHLEDYFICDGDVVWDGEYLDFVRVNEDGVRVLDHSKIDMLKPLKVAGVVTQAIARMGGEVARHKAESGGKPSDAEGGLRRRMWKTMSNSLTRAA